MNSYRYKMESTSLVSSKFEDIELWKSENELTRKILRAEVVENQRVKENTVKVALVHQRRGRTTDEWEDLGGKLLSELKAGESAKFPLDTDQTKALFVHLANLYKIGEEGVRLGTTVLEIADEDKVIKVDSSRARIIKKLLEGGFSEEIWGSLVEEDPDLATKISLSRIYQERKKLINEFEEKIAKSLGEEHWQSLLAKDRWIFGNSYIGRIGERRINIKSTLDHPLITEDGFMEIVEIKAPEFPFWKRRQDGENFLYRGKYLVHNSELENAITQGANYILEAEKEIDSKSWAESHDGIYPIKPKCLVVHGRSSRWGATEAKAYRLLNDRLHGIIVITFDHLLLRAKQTLEVFNPENYGKS